MKKVILAVITRHRYNRNAIKQGKYWVINKIANSVGLELVADIAEIKRLECSGICKELYAYSHGETKKD